MITSFATGAVAVGAALAVALAPGAAPAPPGPTPPAPDDLAAAEVSFRAVDGLQLGGTLFTPRGRSGPLPAMLLVHGSGTGGPGYREQLRGEAEAFARQGIAVLATDKREEGYTPFHRDLSQLADDALAAFAVLRARPEVDPATAGIWGLSEGGWVAPLAASRSADIAFVVTAGAPGISPLAQQAWNVRNKLAWSGIGGSMTTAFPVTWHRMISDAGMFPAHHDPARVLARVRQPVLALWGARDVAVPPADSAGVFGRALAAGGNPDLTVRFVPGAVHSLHRVDGRGEPLPALVPGYADAVGAWVRAVATGRRPAPHVDPPPAQSFPAVEPTRPAWWESAPVQFGAQGLFLVAFGSYPVLALVRRLRGRAAEGSAPARVLAVTGLLTALGLVTYLSVLMSAMTEYGVQAGPLLGDRPLCWLALQVGAVAATVATVLLASRWRGSTDRARHGLLILGGAVFVPWALYWGLLLP